MRPLLAGIAIPFQRCKGTNFFLTAKIFRRFLLQKITGDAVIHAIDSHDSQNTCYNTVKYPEGTHIKMRPHLIYKVCYQPPPEQCSGKDGNVAKNIMIVFKLRHYKVKPRKQANDEEQNQWIGKGKQKAGNEILPEAIRLIIGLFKRYGWVLTEKIEGKSNQHQATKNL
jgi:hypothetical protein